MLDLVFRRMTKLDAAVASGKQVPDALQVEQPIAADNASEKEKEDEDKGAAFFDKGAAASSSSSHVTFGENAYPQLVAMLGFKAPDGS